MSCISIQCIVGLVPFLQFMGLRYANLGPSFSFGAGGGWDEVSFAYLLVILMIVFVLAAAVIATDEYPVAALALVLSYIFLLRRGLNLLERS